jgi:hypothetical protein
MSGELRDVIARLIFDHASTYDGVEMFVAEGMSDAILELPEIKAALSSRRIKTSAEARNEVRDPSGGCALG